MRHEASLLKDILAAIGKIEGITAATPEESFFGDGSYRRQCCTT